MDKYPDFSLSCIATIDYQEAVYAICRTLEALPSQFTSPKVYWLSDIDFPNKGQLEQLGAELVWVKIAPFALDQSFNEQLSHLTLRRIPQIVETDFNLIVQNDGFAVNREAWTDAFLQYDYIGATWPHCDVGENVGNGGFCLRSKKLYEALKVIKPEVDFFHLSQKFAGIESYSDRFGHRSVPEDYVICTLYRQQLIEDFGIRFAPLELAEQFSVEHNYESSWLGKSFGFHGFMAKSFYPDA